RSRPRARWGPAAFGRAASHDPVPASASVRGAVAYTTTAATVNNASSSSPPMRTGSRAGAPAGSWLSIASEARIHAQDDAGGIAGDQELFVGRDHPGRQA